MVAADGRQRLEQLAARRPTCCHRIMMPVMDGPEMLERMRRDAATAGVPVVVMTAGRGSLDGLRYDSLVTKPFRVEEVLAVVERLIGR